MNPYVKLARLLPTDPVLFGTVVSSAGGFVVVQLPGGNQVTVRGAATVSSNVFIRGGAIDSEAPALPLDVDVV